MEKKLAIGLILTSLALPHSASAQRDIACSITATPSRAAPGEQVTLRWNSQNARSATLAGFGPVPLQGSRVIQATQTTDYKVLVSGFDNNYVGCIARLSVVAKQPTCNISLVPFSIAANNFATLSWSTEHADSVYISGIGNVQGKGNQMVRATGNTTYQLSARGAGGMCERSATLSVQSQYQSYGYFAPTVQSIAAPLFGYSNNSTPRTTSSYPQNSYSSGNYYGGYGYDNYNSGYWYENDAEDYNYWYTYPNDAADASDAVPGMYYTNDTYYQNQYGNNAEYSYPPEAPYEPPADPYWNSGVYYPNPVEEIQSWDNGVYEPTIQTNALEI